VAIRIGLTAAATAVWLICTLALLTGGWYLACTVEGADLRGIDCIQAFPGSAHAQDAPARWVGFIPLTLMWVAANAALAFALFQLVKLTRHRARTS
jgi:hypothetical protein